MEHKISLNSRISYEVEIYIFRFDKYWQTVFYLMELDTVLNFKGFLKSEAVNANKKSYYQLYYLNQMRAFNDREMAKQQIYENILER